ncbi:MAG: hypothetical protein ACI9JM_000635 [Halioglobus sp.]|jgi:hypothetical protein
MKKFIVISIVLLLPQVAMARVYMCVDPATGVASFTDKACTTGDLREEVRVDATNLDSGSKYVGAGPKKTWRSEEDTRKSGLDYNAEKRGIYESGATASK